MRGPAGEAPRTRTGESMTRAISVLVVLTLVAIGAATAQQRGGGNRTSIKPGDECPPGTTEVRPGSCQAPETPPPSIVDYRPRSTLVTEQHLVPKAKFPAIDVHGHPPSLASAENIKTVIAAMDALNLRVMVSADNSSGERFDTRARGHQRERLQGSLPRAGRRGLPQRRAGLGATARSSNSKRTSKQAPSASAKSRRASASTSGSRTDRG